MEEQIEAGPDPEPPPAVLPRRKRCCGRACHRCRAAFAALANYHRADNRPCDRRVGQRQRQTAADRWRRRSDAASRCVFPSRTRLRTVSAGRTWPGSSRYFGWPQPSGLPKPLRVKQECRWRGRSAATSTSCCGKHYRTHKGNLAMSTDGNPPPVTVDIVPDGRTTLPRWNPQPGPEDRTCSTFHAGARTRSLRRPAASSGDASTPTGRLSRRPGWRWATSRAARRLLHDRDGARRDNGYRLVIVIAGTTEPLFSPEP